MKSISAEESLWIVLPILLVVIALISGIFFLNKNSTDVRSRASEPKTNPGAIITPLPNPDLPEVVCASIYAPVCGSNGKTYPNSCEANLSGIKTFVNGPCQDTVTVPEL